MPRDASYGKSFCGWPEYLAVLYTRVTSYLDVGSRQEVGFSVYGLSFFKQRNTR